MSGATLAHRRDLQRLAHEGRLGDIAHADAGDVGALLRLDRDEPLLGEAGERLRQRLARDAEAVADLGLVDLRAGLRACSEMMAERSSS